MQKVHVGTNERALLDIGDHTRYKNDEVKLQNLKYWCHYPSWSLYVAESLYIHIVTAAEDGSPSLRTSSSSLAHTKELLDSISIYLNNEG